MKKYIGVLAILFGLVLVGSPKAFAEYCRSLYGYHAPGSTCPYICQVNVFWCDLSNSWGCYQGCADGFTCDFDGAGPNPPEPCVWYEAWTTECGQCWPGGGGGTPTYMDIGGYVVDANTSTGIENVDVDVCGSNGGCTTVTTDSSGFFRSDDYVNETLNSFSVRIVGNTVNPQTAPPGYTPPATTTTGSFAYNICDNQDQPLGSESYECQDWNGGVSCANDQGGPHRCNFEYQSYQPPTGKVLFHLAPESERVRDVSVGSTETFSATIYREPTDPDLSEIKVFACETSTGCNDSFDWTELGNSACAPGATFCSITVDSSAVNFVNEGETWYVVVNGYSIDSNLWCSGNPTPNSIPRCDRTPPIEISDYLTLNLVGFEITGKTTVVDNIALCTDVDTLDNSLVGTYPSITYAGTYLGQWTPSNGNYQIPQTGNPALPVGTGSLCSTDSLPHASIPGVEYKFKCIIDNDTGVAQQAFPGFCPPVEIIDQDKDVDLGYELFNSTPFGWIQALDGDVYGYVIASDVPKDVGQAQGGFEYFVGVGDADSSSAVFSSDVNIDDDLRISEQQRYIDGSGTPIDTFWADDISFEAPYGATSVTSAADIRNNLETTNTYVASASTVQAFLNNYLFYDLQGLPGVAVIYVEGNNTIEFPTRLLSSDSGKRILFIFSGDIEYNPAVGTLVSGNPNVSVPDIEAGVITRGSIIFPAAVPPTQDRVIVLEGPQIALGNIEVARNLELENNFYPVVAVKYNPIYLEKLLEVEYSNLPLIDIQWLF